MTDKHLETIPEEMKPSKAVEERITDILNLSENNFKKRELIVAELTTLEARVREEEREKIWSWAINNGITHKKSFVALRDYINSINTKEE